MTISSKKTVQLLHITKPQRRKPICAQSSPGGTIDVLRRRSGRCRPSGSLQGKILIGPLFGFVAGWLIDRFGPRRLMLAGLLSGGAALMGLGWTAALPLFYAFFIMNSLGYVCGGPLPNQVLLARWFDRTRGIAMGFAYLGIGIGGAVAPQLAHYLTVRFGWHAAPTSMGGIFLLISLPLAAFVKDAPRLIRA